MRKYISLFMVVTLVLTMVGCANSSANSAAPAANKSSGNPYELTGPINLRFASSGTGTSDYTDVGTMVSFLSGSGILPAGSKITHEIISTGTSGSGYLLQADMADVTRGQNALAATKGLEGRGVYTDVVALFGGGGNSVCMQLASPAFNKKTGYTSIEEIIENKYPATICSEDVGSTDGKSTIFRTVC